jgi:hypothetical protein
MIQHQIFHAWLHLCGLVSGGKQAVQYVYFVSDSYDKHDMSFRRPDLLDSSNLIDEGQH